MNSEHFVTSMLIGLLTGGVAGIMMRNGGRGWVWDLVLGVIGSSAASGLWGILAPETGKFAMAALAFVGAVLVILVQRKVWQVPA
jgi:uncharacterized membrane protein YeaQ/YmgE (transglycosylase-associated protein family)